jgi:hypothetical protein
MILARDNMRIVISDDEPFAVQEQHYTRTEWNAKVYINGVMAGYSEFDYEHHDEFKRQGWQVL